MIPDCPGVSATSDDRSGPSARGAAVTLVVILIMTALAAGCTRKIGDNCNTNVECSPQGDRFCDIASPEGYCTIDSCEYQTCPDSANCVRFYSLKANSGQCTAGLVARADCPQGQSTADRCCKPGAAGCCLTGELCLCEDSGCTRARCASSASERRWCMANCDDDSDCREGYSCLTTGANGAEPIPYRDADGTLVDRPPALKALRFCAPKVIGQSGQGLQGPQPLQTVPPEEPRDARGEAAPAAVVEEPR